MNKTKFESSVRMVFGVYFLAYLILDHYKVLEKPILIFIFLCSIFLTDFFFEHRTNNVPRYVEGVISPDEIRQKKKRVLKIISVFLVIYVVGILIALLQT
jgi:multisubunit Na+/H+ antiporter MnhB subunit